MTADADVRRRDLEPEVSTFALDVYWAAGQSGDPSLDAHVAGCDRCRAYLASLDALAANAPALPAPMTRETRPARRRSWIVPVAGTLALAAAVALFFRGKPVPGDGYVGIKGTPAVQLLLHRDRDTRVWDGHSPLHPGDAIALRIACEGLKRVVVAAPGASGDWAPLSSNGCPANDEPLPFTLQVDSEPGDEKLAVVLSQDELDPGALQKAIAETRRTADVWVLSFVMPKETEKNQ
jgi:hypothetical protein